MAAPAKLVRVKSDSDLKVTKLKVKKGQQVSKGSIFCLYSTKANTNQKFKCSHEGIVTEILVKDGEEVMAGNELFVVEGCNHPTVMKDMCADCGADLRLENSTAGNRKEEVKASVAMVHSIPELIVSEEQAKQLGMEDEGRLLKTRKLVLLVDLDQTLIHTTNDNIPTNLKDVHHFQLWHGHQLLWYHTRLRPHTQRFLENIAQMYELHICTFGVRMYAHTIAKILDPEGKYFSHRILSRDECFNASLKTANLKALFPCGDAMVCIIDDREDVWNFSQNLIHVKPYRFFQGTADINAPPGLTKTEKDNQPIVHRVRRVSQSSTASMESKESEQNSQNDNQKEKSDDTTKNEDQAKTDVSSENKDKTQLEEKMETEEINNKTSNSDQCLNNNKDVDELTNSEKLETKIEQDDDDKENQCLQIDLKETDEMNTSKPDDDKTKNHETEKKDGETVQKEKPPTEQAETKSDESEKMEDDLIEWDDEDDYLLHLEEVLTNIHTAFYSMHDEIKGKESIEKEKEKPNLKNLIPYIKKKVLKGCNLVFSGVIPTNMQVEKSRAFTVAKALGATFQADFVTKFNENDKQKHTTHLVAAKLGTNKVRTALKHKNIRIVSVEWLWSCSERWERVEEQLFPLVNKESDSLCRDSPDVTKMTRKRKVETKDKSGSQEKRSKVENIDNDSNNASSEDADDNDINKEMDQTDAADNENKSNNGNDNSGNKKADSSEESPSTSKQMQVSVSDKPEPSTSAQPAKVVGSRQDRFSLTYNPLAAFSDEDLEYMDKEVEDELDDENDDENESEEEEDDRDNRLRKNVLKARRDLEVSSSSSEESLCGEMPRGWGIHKKMSPKSSSSDDEGKKSPKSKYDNDALGPEYESETDQDKFEKIMDAFGPVTDNSDENDVESIGSVDDEMADAVEKEFLS